MAAFIAAPLPHDQSLARRPPAGCGAPVLCPGPVLTEGLLTAGKHLLPILSARRDLEITNRQPNDGLQRYPSCRQMHTRDVHWPGVAANVDMGPVDGYILNGVAFGMPVIARKVSSLGRRQLVTVGVAMQAPLRPCIIVRDHIVPVREEEANVVGTAERDRSVSAGYCKSVSGIR
jgi:hypothetical protein